MGRRRRYEFAAAGTARDSAPFFGIWFCGGLDYQVEHHLFPCVPRHHLKKVNELTMAYCAARGVTYHETSLIAGTVEVLKHLKDIAEEFVEEFPAM